MYVQMKLEGLFCVDGMAITSYLGQQQDTCTDLSTCGEIITTALDAENTTGLCFTRGWGYSKEILLLQAMWLYAIQFPFSFRTP